MAEYDNKNTFTLFRNNRKTEDKHPDFNGTFTDSEGREYWMSGWSRTPKSGGEKFLGGTMRLKEDKPASAPAPRAKPVSLDDEVPF